MEKGDVSLASVSEEQVFRTLENALQLPVYAARKMLRCFDVEMPNGDSKAEVASLYPLLEIPGATDILFQIRDMDSLYSETLAEQLLRLNRGKYEQSIEELKAAIPLALEFARKNLFALR